MSYSKVYAFDWDDNILHMPSTMILYRRVCPELYPVIREALVQYSKFLHSETTFTLPEDFMALTDDNYQSITTLIGDSSSLNIAIPYSDCSLMEIKDDTPLSPTTSSSAFASDAVVSSTKLAELLSSANDVRSFFPPSQRHSSRSSTSQVGTSLSSAPALYFLLPRESNVQDDADEHSLSSEASHFAAACPRSSPVPTHITETITEAVSQITQPCYRIVTLAPSPCLPSCHHCTAVAPPSPPSVPASPAFPASPSSSHPHCRQFLHRDHVSTQAFARMRASLAQHHCMLKADSYLNFSSSAAFTADVAAALQARSTAAAYERFKLAAMGANLITIVTARGQHPRALRAGLRMVVGSWSDEERRVMRENVLRVYGREWELVDEEDEDDEEDDRTLNDAHGAVNGTPTRSVEVALVTAETPHTMATPPAPSPAAGANDANSNPLSHTLASTSPYTRTRTRTRVRALYPALAHAADPVAAYLEHVVAVFPVSSTWFKHTFVHSRCVGYARATATTTAANSASPAITAYNPEVGKQIALGHYLRQCLAAVRYQQRHHHIHLSTGTGTDTERVPASSTTPGPGGDYLLAFGFSDDDKRNVHAISALFATLCVEYPDVKFVVYDTSEPGKMKKIVISSESPNKQI